AAEQLQGRVALAMRVVAEPSQSGERAEELLAEEAGAGFDRHADHDPSARRAEPSELADNPPPLGFEAVLEDFHARHDVPRAGVRGAEIGGHRKPDTGKIAEALATG